MLLISSGAVLLAGFIFLSFIGGTTVRTPIGPSAPTRAPVSLPVIREVSSFSLTNQLGAPLTRDGLVGRPWAVNLIFTRCPGPCAQLSGVMRSVQTALPTNATSRLLSLTSDPVYDTPSVLAAYASKFAADPARWFFVTGVESEVRRLAVKDMMLVLQEKSPERRESPDDLFLHSTAIVILDRKARVRHVVEGLQPGAAEAVVTALTGLEREAAP